MLLQQLKSDSEFVTVIRAHKKQCQGAGRMLAIQQVALYHASRIERLNSRVPADFDAQKAQDAVQTIVDIRPWS